LLGCLNLTTILFSGILTLLLTIFFDSWFLETQQFVAAAAEVNSSYEFKTFDIILIGGSFYDAITLIVVNIVLIWQASILARILKKDSQIKPKLS